MSKGNSSNDGDGNGGRWGSKFFKVVGVAAATVAVTATTVAVAVPAATVAVAGGVLALRASSSQQSDPFEAAPDDEEEDDDNEAASLQIRWTKPEPGWVKLNVDGSRDHISYPPSSGCGGVLRDESGKWLLGFAQKLDPSCEVHETELEAILKGIELVSERKYKKLVVESDHKSAVSMVEKGVRKNHPQYTIISSIRQLLSDPKWKVKVVHVPRNANRVANRLAIDARGLSSEDLLVYPYTPTENIKTLILKDSQGGAVGYY